MGIKTDWDRGFEAGHAQGLYDAKEQSSASPACSTATLDDLSMLIRQLAHSLKKARPDSELPDRAVDYLARHGLQGSPLR